MIKINKTDKQYLERAISIAKKTFGQGNYPVGAVLAIDGEIIDSAGNEINKEKSYVNHAENTLIIRNGQKLYDAYQAKKEIVLYSTLEPCIQCLGASVTNHVNKIVYIQKDPNGGACNLRHDNIGVWYQDTWPEILYAPISTEPREMMISFFKQEISKGNTKWPKKMLSLLEVA